MDMLKTPQEVAKDIEAGRRLVLAGDERLFASLPKGTWIGGTIPYFMDEKGGRITRDHLFVHDVTDFTESASIGFYSVDELRRIPADAPENGFSILIIPATSRAHIAYAQDAPNYEGIFTKPILGWISGVHLQDLGKVTPKVFNGLTGTGSDQKAVVIHCAIPSGRRASIGIVNLFKQGSGDTLRFEEEGFTVKNCLVNGERQNFARYLKQHGIDTRLPLVANYSGAMVNVSFQIVREKDGEVDLYAPVFDHLDYRIAAPVGNYLEDFKQALPKGLHAAFSCNCILNFLYSELEGRTTEGMYGPITFGEIAYQLLNQTLVYLEIL
jgi:hypothetical protein